MVTFGVGAKTGRDLGFGEEIRPPGWGGPRGSLGGRILGPGGPRGHPGGTWGSPRADPGVRSGDRPGTGGEISPL